MANMVVWFRCTSNALEWTEVLPIVPMVGDRIVRYGALPGEERFIVVSREFFELQVDQNQWRLRCLVAEV